MVFGGLGTMPQGRKTSERDVVATEEIQMVLSLNQANMRS